MMILLVLFLSLISPVLSWAGCTYTAQTISCTAASASHDASLSLGSKGESADFYAPYTNTDRVAALRFQPNVPKNATITAATITFTAAGSIGNTANAYIDRFDYDDCPVLSTSSYAWTMHEIPVEWSVSAWTAASTYTTDNFASIITDWITEDGYDYGHYLGLKIYANASTSAHRAYQAYTSNATSLWPVLAITFTGGDPVLSDVYMAEPYSRSKQYLYVQLWNTANTQKLKTYLDGVLVSTKTNIAGQTTGGEEAVLVDYTGLTAGSHTLRMVVTDGSDTEYASTEWTRTWTTTHNGTPYVSIDENNNIVVAGNKILPITDFLQDASKWNDFPDAGDTWTDWFNSSWLFGSTYTETAKENYIKNTAGPAWRWGPGGGNWFSGTAPRYSMIDFSLAETFEGTNIYPACGTGFCWTSSGTVDFDDTSAPIAGSQSLKVTGDSYAQLLLNNVYGKVRIKLSFKATTRSGVTDLISIVDDTDEVIGKVKINASNHLEGHHCSGGACDPLTSGYGEGSYTVSADTVYNLWLEYYTSTIGEQWKNGGMEIYVSTSATQPSSPDIILVEDALKRVGWGKGAIKYIRLASSTDNVILFDSLTDDVRDLKEWATVLADTTTYPKFMAWVIDDEPDMGGASDWNNAIRAQQDLIRALDTNHPNAILAYGRNYDLQSATYSRDSYARATNYMLYMSNYLGWGTKTVMADILVYDHYFHHYSWQTEPKAGIGSKLGWYPDYENFVDTLDRVVNGMYNLIPVGIMFEPDDLSDDMCTPSTTLFAWPCTANARTLNVPVGSVTGTLEQSSKAAPKYVRFGGDNSKVAEVLDVRLNEGTAADNDKFKVMYPYPHPEYNSHIVIHALNSSFNPTTIANGDAIVDCTSITGAYGSVTCTATGSVTAQAITGAEGKVPRLLPDKRRPGGTGYVVWSPMPTSDGLTNAMWLSFIHGAKLIGQFNYHTLNYYMHKTPLENFKVTADALKDVILSAPASTLFTIPSANKGGWASATVAGTGRVDYTVRSSGGLTYVFAARVKKHTGDTSGDETATFALTGLPAGTTVYEYGTANTVTADAGSFQDTFDYHDVKIYYMDLDEPVGGDETAPVISDVSPTGAQACTTNPQSITRTWTTDEPADCTIGGVAAGTTGGTSHSDTASQACGASYTPAIICTDAAANESAATNMNYSIAADATVTRWGILKQEVP